MDVPKVVVRFHYKGQFVIDGKGGLHYSGGSEALSCIDRDKVSLPEVMGHLRDHCQVEEGVMLQWLVPGKTLSDGLRVLNGDKVCLDMAEAVREGIADVYVDYRSVRGEVKQEVTDFEKEMNTAEEESDVEVIGSRTIHIIDSSPTDNEKDFTTAREFYGKRKPGCSKNLSIAETGTSMVADEEISSEDSDYLPGDCSGSEADEEAEQILVQFKEFKRNLRAGQIANLDDVTCGRQVAVGGMEIQCLDDGYDTPYRGSGDDEDDSYGEEGSDVEILGHGYNYPRYKNKSSYAYFTLGMKFANKRDFKDAVIKYALAEMKVINFVKDEVYRVRAKCDWETCPWVCLLSTNSRSTSWQITSFTDEHTCTPRTDNKLVTARRIANRYENMIKANPQWNLMHMKATIREEMRATVSISKIKRAKAIVMEKMFNATKGEYSRVFDYQLELLRTNPGSTVIVKLDTNEREPVFQRLYVCFNACKQGFMAGCRKVIGLDGCFFKGATSGELLCALGCDANNQMYPVAWAVVEKENNDSWDWFCDLVCRDIQVGSGDGWVFISDQQKGILNAIAKWAPNAEHRNCARHIYANWKKKFKKKEYQKPWWGCAKAPNKVLFNLAKALLAQQTLEGARAMMNTAPEHWCRAWFRLGTFCDSVDNNMCESFNKWIVDARFYPIISMLEAIRKKVMIRIQQMRDKCERWSGTVCPNIFNKLKSNIKESAFCHAISNCNDAYEVRHRDQRFVVHLKEKTCSCRY